MPSGGRLASSASARPLEERVLYYPDRERVLTSGDGSGDDMHWQTLGMSFPALLADVRYGLTLTDTPLVDKDGNSKGILIPGSIPGHSAGGGRVGAMGV